MKRITIIAAILCLWANQAYAITAARINANLTVAKEQYTIPTGDHEIEAPILLQSGKTLRMAAGCRLIVRGKHYAIHGNGVKNFGLELGEIINHCRENSGYATNVYFYQCTNGTIRGGPIHGGWAGVNLTKCSNLAFANVLVSDTTYGVGWMLAGNRNITLDYCGGNGCGWDGLRLIADNENISVFGGDWCRNGAVLATAGNGTAGSGIEIGQGGVNVSIRAVNCSDNIGLGIVVKTSQKPETIYSGDIPFGECKNITVDQATLNGNGYHGFYCQWRSDLPGVPQPANITLNRINAGKNGESGVWCDADGVSLTNSVLRDNKSGLTFFKTCKSWSQSGNVLERNRDYQKLLPTDYK